MNSWSGIGNIGSKPTFRTTGKGRSVLNFSIAIDRDRKAESTEATERTADWFPIVVFGEAADHHVKYLQKGTKIAVSGALRPRSYVDSAGITHNTFEIQAEVIDWLANVQSPQVVTRTVSG